MEVRYIDEGWPVVVLKVIGEPQSEEDVQDIIRVWNTIITESMLKNERYRLVFDVRQSSLTKMELLKTLADFLIRVKSLNEKWMERTAILVGEERIKVFIKFVFMFYKPVRPFKVFTNDRNSLEWLASNDPGDDPERNFLKEKKAIKDSKISFN